MPEMQLQSYVESSYKLPVGYVEGSYDLPVSYDESRITIMPRDPHWLFVYWEITGNKRSDFIREFGSEIWQRSYPVLKVTNLTKNTSSFIRINDYANNWYVNVADSNCLYTAEIGRTINDRFFIGFVSSNFIKTPGNTVSSNNTVYFSDYRNVRFGEVKEKPHIAPEAVGFKPDPVLINIPASYEMYGFQKEYEIYGVSSLELAGISSLESMGVSSLESMGISSLESMGADSL